MAIDAATVRKVAKLARIAESEDRLAGLAQELTGIMTWIEQLNEVDIDGVVVLGGGVVAAVEVAAVPAPGLECGEAQPLGKLKRADGD